MATLKIDPKDHGIKGFTLIEVLIVIGILIILSSISISMFTAFQKNSNLREAAGALAEDIKLARQRAMAENVNYTITFNQTNNSYTIQSGAGTYNVTKKLQELFGRGIIIYNQNFASSTMNLQKRGTCDTGTIKLKNSINSELDITTNIMGKVTIVKIS